MVGSGGGSLREALATAAAFWAADFGFAFCLLEVGLLLLTVTFPFCLLEVGLLLVTVTFPFSNLFFNEALLVLLPLALLLLALAPRLLFFAG